MRLGKIAENVVRKIAGVPVRIFYFTRTGYWHTGERANPDFLDNGCLFYHVKAYQFAAELVSGDVLDVGCGCGYGTEMLAYVANSAVGIDYSPQAIKFARSRYTTARFEVMNAQHLSFPDASFDFVYSSENFEHLPDQAGHLRELRRVLRPGGICFIATPDPEVLAGIGRNRWHLKENNYDELIELFRREFSDFVIIENRKTPVLNRGLIPCNGTVSVFGEPLSTEHLANDLSFYCFLR